MGHFRFSVLFVSGNFESTFMLFLPPPKKKSWFYVHFSLHWQVWATKVYTERTGNIQGGKVYSGLHGMHKASNMPSQKYVLFLKRRLIIPFFHALPTFLIQLYSSVFHPTSAEGPATNCQRLARYWHFMFYCRVTGVIQCVYTEGQNVTAPKWIILHILEL